MIRHDKIRERLLEQANRVLLKLNKNPSSKFISDYDIETLFYRSGILRYGKHDKSENRNLDICAEFFEHLYGETECDLMVKILTMKFYEGKTIRQIARIIGVSHTTIWKKMKLAYKIIKSKKLETKNPS